MANVFVTGMTGTGKSYFIRWLLKKNDLPCVVVSLKKSDINNFSQEVKPLTKIGITNENYKNIKKLTNYVGNKNIGFYMDFISPKNIITFIDELSLILRNKSDILVYIDEVHNFIGEKGQYSQNLISLISMAREQNIHIIMATQRPQDVKKSALNNCKYKVSFLLSETNAVKAMSNIFEDIDGNEIKTLKPYYFIIQNSFTKETEKNIKI